jgi:hypothetical protein
VLGVVRAPDGVQARPQELGDVAGVDRGHRLDPRDLVDEAVTVETDQELAEAEPTSLSARLTTPTIFRSRVLVVASVVLSRVHRGIAGDGRAGAHDDVAFRPTSAAVSAVPVAMSSASNSRFGSSQT